MSGSDWLIVLFFSVFFVVGVAGMRKVLATPDKSLGQRMVGLLFFAPFLIVGIVPMIGAVSLYSSRYFASDAAVTQPPWQYPAGAYYPTFCAFGTVETQVQPTENNLTGRGSLKMDRALAYVEGAGWPVDWRRYERIIQDDAVMVGYTNGSSIIDYVFLAAADGGSDCFLSWSGGE